MQYKSLFIGLALVTVFSISSVARSDHGPTQQQDLLRLENRINQMEQRLYSIDTTLRNVEQQSRLGATVRGANPEDVARLRLELQALQNRLAEHECALSKLDERTLSPAMRAARRKSGPGGNDPCRLNFETPLQFLNTRDD